MEARWGSTPSQSSRRHHPARRRLVVLLAGSLLLGACTGGDATTTSTTGAPAHAVSGYAHAGPVCPVETTPPDPNCADRPVAGAVLRVVDASGVVVAEVTTAADGTFSLMLPAGTFTLIPQPVEGLMGTAAEVELAVDGPLAGIDLAYDTGIR